MENLTKTKTRQKIATKHLIIFAILAATASVVLGTFMAGFVISARNYRLAKHRPLPARVFKQRVYRYPYFYPYPYFYRRVSVRWPDHGYKLVLPTRSELFKW